MATDEDGVVPSGVGHLQGRLHHMRRCVLDLDSMPPPPSGVVGLDGYGLTDTDGVMTSGGTGSPRTLTERRRGERC